MMYRVSPAPLRADEKTMFSVSNREKTATKRSAAMAIGRISSKLSASAWAKNILRKTPGTNQYSAAAVAMYMKHMCAPA